MERQEVTSFTAHVGNVVRYGVRDRTSDRDPTKTTCVVEFRSGEAVHRHPDLKRYVNEGWKIRSAAPYVKDADCVQLLVVLERCDSTK